MSVAGRAFCIGKPVGWKWRHPRTPPIQRFEDELFEKLYAGEAESLPEKHQDTKWSAWASAIHDACEKLPAFNRLADETRGDADAAALGVEELLKELQPIIDEQNANQPPEESIRKLVRMGAESASAALEEYRDAVDGLGQVMFGSGKGNHERQALDDKKVGLARRLRGDPRLKRIAQLAGRFTRIGQQKRRSKVRHGAEEICDVELGNDLGGCCPSNWSSSGIHGCMHWLCVTCSNERPCSTRSRAKRNWVRGRWCAVGQVGVDEGRC
jgi:hypothetical protein